MPRRILIVDDEPLIVKGLKYSLEQEGYETDSAADGEEALNKFFAQSYDLVLLDLMLPELSGMEVIRRLRRESQIPVIMLTARDTVMDKVYGLDMGADDYITKPFAIEELLARIRNALRKRPAAAEKTELLTCGPVAMDVARHQVTCAGKPVDLTGREFDVLKLLLENQQIVLSRETFLTRVWGYDYMGETNVVDVYIRYLRSKLDDVCGVTLIHTVRGVGYVLRES